MRLNGLLRDIHEAERRFWFIQQIQEIDETDDAVKARLQIQVGLFVQVFFSEQSGRFSLALIQGNQRIYGRDREFGTWHLHPYESPEHHDPVPEGMSPQPLFQFLAEVEQIIIENELI